jgi:RNA polymerase sigma factor (sigma-70 family)
MRPHLSPGSVSPSGTDDMDLQLLQDTQAYLECRFRGQAPRVRWSKAWERFYRKYSPLIRHFAHACRVPKADLDDCVQEVWTDLVESLRGFNYDPRRGQFRSWLYTVVHSKVTDLVRYRARHPTASLDSQLGGALGSLDADPAAAYQRQSKQDTVRRVLGELRRRVSARNYQLMHLRWMEGWTLGEIAAALNLTPDQVRFRHHRLRRKLQGLFDPGAGQDSD